MADRRVFLIAGGILLVGAGIGIAYIVMQNKPKSQIMGTPTVTRNADGTVTVKATVANVGRKQGYFKLQALLAAPECPQGRSGYLGAGSTEWANVLNCIMQAPGTKGVWCGLPTGGWVTIQPGQQMVLQASSQQPLQPGTYNLYVNAAVSTEGSTQSRLFDREHYLWVPGVSVR